MTSFWSLARECGILDSKLPTEDQLHEFMGHVEAEACSMKGLASIDSVIQEAKDDSPVSIDPMWIGESFRDKLNPLPRLTIAGDEKNSGIGNWTTSHKEHRAGISVNLASTLLPPDVFMMREIIDKRTFEKGSISMSSGGYLRNFDYRVEGMRSSLKSAQQEIFLEELKSKGYIAKRPIPELTMELEARRIQFPKTKIYIFAGSDLSYYMNGMHQSKYWRETPIICVTGPIRHRPWAEENIIKPFESAVISEAQMNANYSFEMYYYLHKVPRWWYIYYGLLMRFSLEILPCPGSEKTLIREPVKELHSRFGHITEEI